MCLLAKKCGIQVNILQGFCVHEQVVLFSWVWVCVGGCAHVLWALEMLSNYFITKLHTDLTV